MSPFSYAHFFEQFARVHTACATIKDTLTMTTSLILTKHPREIIICRQLDESNWNCEVGTELPVPVFGASMLTARDGMSLFLIAGQDPNTLQQYKTTYVIQCRVFECEFTLSERELKVARVNAVAMPAPRDFLTSNCI